MKQPPPASSADCRTVSMPERRCPLCGAARVAPLFVKHETPYWKCGCSFCFSTPDVNPNLANAIDDFEAAYLQYLEPNPADRANFDALYSWMTSIVPLEGARLLDVGAGSGKLVRDLLRLGVDARGIEPSRALFDRFLAGDQAFARTTIEDVHDTFNAVTTFDVIEHVADPNRFADAIAERVAPGGVWFLSTPDAATLTARAFGRYWHFYSPYHLSYFSPRTLDRLAERHGFRRTHLAYPGRIRSVGYMVRYVAEFIGGGAAPPWASRLDGWHFPVNLFDTMQVALRRSVT
jgi:SAM-dependent methyltransferase